MYTSDMVLYFRLFLSLITWFFRPRIVAGTPVEQTFRVWPFDTEFLALNASRYLSLAEIVQAQHNYRCRFYHAGFRDGIWAAARSSAICYRRPVKMFAKVRIRSEVIGWNEKYFVWENLFSNMGGDLLALSYTKVSVRDKKGPVKVIDVMKSIGYDGPEKQVSNEVWQLLETPQKMFEIQPRASRP